MQTYPDAPPTGGSHRLAEIRNLTGEIERGTGVSDGDFSAFGMLITDASLAGDAPALEGAMDGLQGLYRRYATEEHATEARGRVLGLIDVAHWSLRRLPSTLQLRLNPDSHATRFLIAVANRPGVSNTDLGTSLGVDETEVSRLGRRLLAAGVVGKRRVWRHNVWDVTPRGRQYLATSGLLHQRRYSVGVKVLPGRLVGVIMDRAGEVLNHSGSVKFLPRTSSRAHVVEEIATFAQEIVDKYTLDARPGDWVLGVEVGGHVSTKDGRVVHAPNYGRNGWHDLELADAITARLDVPVAVENDANALALYERQFGDHRGLDNAVTVVVGEGVGCGIVANGALLHGETGAAGEIGHVVVQHSGPKCERCGRRGCVESLASVGAIAGAQHAPDEHDPAAVVQAVASLVERRERTATQRVRQAGDALGRGLSALISLVDPERITVYAPEPLVADGGHTREVFLTAARKASTGRVPGDRGGSLLEARTYDHETGAKAAATVALLRYGALEETPA